MKTQSHLKLALDSELRKAHAEAHRATQEDRKEGREKSVYFSLYQYMEDDKYITGAVMEADSNALIECLVEMLTRQPEAIPIFEKALYEAMSVGLPRFGFENY